MAEQAGDILFLTSQRGKLFINRLTNLVGRGIRKELPHHKPSAGVNHTSGTQNPEGKRSAKPGCRERKSRRSSNSGDDPRKKLFVEPDKRNLVLDMRNIDL